jgi:hypothetical protein
MIGLRERHAHISRRTQRLTCNVTTRHVSYTASSRRFIRRSDLDGNSTDAYHPHESDDGIAERLHVKELGI